MMLWKGCDSKLNISDIVLKPCAHCGSNSVYLYRSVSDDIIHWRVECYDCGMRTEDYTEEIGVCSNGIVESMASAISCAVETWNARVGDKTSATEVKSIVGNQIYDEVMKGKP